MKKLTRVNEAGQARIWNALAKRSDDSALDILCLATASSYSKAASPLRSAAALQI